MKNLILTVILTFIVVISSYSQEYLIVTTVESVVPMGVGRSRMIVQTDSLNYRDYTTVRTDGKTAKDKSNRKDLKISKMDETILLNFYSAFGINIQNIASNDAVITSKLTELAKEGWSLMFVTSAVESDAGDKDGHGIFITRFIFYKD